MDEVCVPICCNVGGLWELCGMYSDNVIAILYVMELKPLIKLATMYTFVSLEYCISMYRV